MKQKWKYRGRTRDEYSDGTVQDYYWWERTDPHHATEPDQFVWMADKYREQNTRPVLPPPRPEDPKGVLSMGRTTDNYATTLANINDRLYRVTGYYIHGRGMQVTLEDCGAYQE